MKPNKKTDNSIKTTTKGGGKISPRAGNKMAVQPAKGQSATKTLNVGTASTTMKNGIYAPKPTAAAKAPVKANKPQKFKAPSSKATGMKKAMKQGGNRGGMKCFKK